MAQTGFTPIQIYSSSTAAASPVAGNLTNSTLGSELAINITDGKLFYKDNANAIQVIGWKTVPTTAGGTGLTSYTAGDLLYYATGTTLSNLAIGAANTVLTSSGTAPQWSTGLALTSASSIQVTDNVNAALRITQIGTGNALLVEDSTTPDATPFVVNADGVVITGTTTAYATPLSTNPPRIQQHTAATAGFADQAIFSWRAGVDVAASYCFMRGDSDAIGNYASVDNNDVFGNIRFYGADGSAFVEGVKISAAVDGVPAANDMPGRLMFWTTPSGASTPTERLRIGADGLIAAQNNSGFSIARTSVTAPAATDGNVYSGTYTPTLTNTTNIAASTPFQAQYMRVGNVVTVSGRANIDPTSTTTASEMGISIPIASNFTAANNLGGVGSVATTANEISSGGILADTTNDRATFRFLSGGTAARDYYFTFTYQIL